MLLLCQSSRFAVARWTPLPIVGTTWEPAWSYKSAFPTECACLSACYRLLAVPNVVEARGPWFSHTREDVWGKALTSLSKWFRTFPYGLSSRPELFLRSRNARGSCFGDRLRLISIILLAEGRVRDSKIFNEYGFRDYAGRTIG